MYKQAYKQPYFTTHCILAAIIIIFISPFTFMSSPHLQSSLFFMRINLTKWESTLTLQLQGKVSIPLSLAAPVVSLLMGLQGELLPYLLPLIHPRDCVATQKKAVGLYYQHPPQNTRKTNASLPPRCVPVSCYKQDL